MWRLVVTAATASVLSLTSSAEIEKDFDESSFATEECLEDSSVCTLHLLQRRGKTQIVAQRQPVKGDGPRPKLTGSERAQVMAGRSIYFVVIDRFARTDGNQKYCNSQTDWCGGTLKGIISQLDYIAGMGFDTLWITPVVKQFEGRTKDGTGFMGYWAKDHYEIDPHYGTPQDLKDLVKGLHQRNMTIMLDFVANHVGPIHSAKDVARLNPFNKTEYFHTLHRGSMSFDEYTSTDVKKKEIAPAQAMWSQSGAQCPKGADCNCYSCVRIPTTELHPPPPAWDSCPFGQMVFNKSSPCPKDSLSAFCMPGDFKCNGYNETVMLEGWFYDLGDLNQSVPFVREELKRWIRWMVETYDLDMLRLDTAGFMSFDFLSELQEAAGVPITGEVTATNMSYHSSFQESDGKPVLDGVLNFPMYYTVVAAFCHTFFPRATGNLTFLAMRMIEQSQPGLYKNLDTLGNFADNHDVTRLGHTCKGDVARTVNALVWTMLSKGSPIVYYGTERHYTLERPSFWQDNFSTENDGYAFFKLMNHIRHEFDLDTAEQEVFPFIHVQQMGFTRGTGDKQLWVYLNNMESADRIERYCYHVPPNVGPDHAWFSAATGEKAMFDSDGCLVARTNLPIILKKARSESTFADLTHDFFKTAPNPIHKKEEIYRHLGHKYR